MPYKDKERVRQYQRDWVRHKRAKGSTKIPSLIIEGNRIVGVKKATPSWPDSIIATPFFNKIPLYDPCKHRAGDTVRVLRGKREITLTIPRIDADGQPIPEWG